jgi:hypothetical protein
MNLKQQYQDKIDSWLAIFDKTKEFKQFLYQCRGRYDFKESIMVMLCISRKEFDDYVVTNQISRWNIVIETLEFCKNNRMEDLTDNIDEKIKQRNVFCFCIIIEDLSVCTVGTKE